ncbi:hypothetical protein ACFS4T_02335 [Pseudomonas lini]
MLEKSGSAIEYSHAAGQGAEKDNPSQKMPRSCCASKGLLRGEKPNYYAAAQVARSTGNQSDYIRNRAFNDGYYKDLILDYLRQYGSASRIELVALILDKLSDALDEKNKKQNKFRNLLHSMSTRDQSIEKNQVVCTKAAGFSGVLLTPYRRQTLDKLSL